MPGKNSKNKNRPAQQPSNRRDNDPTPSSSTASSSTSEISDLNSIRSRSPRKVDSRFTKSNEQPHHSLTKPAISQAGTATTSPLTLGNSNHNTLTKTAIGQAGTVDAALGEDELIVDNDVTFPEDMDVLEARKNIKRKREETDSKMESPQSSQPVLDPSPRQPSQDGPQESGWTQVQRKNQPFKIPKTNPGDLREKLSKNPNDLRQQIQQQHLHQSQRQHPQQQHNTYANAAGKNHTPAPPQAPWGPLELRVYCTTFRHAPMTQQMWTNLHLNVMEIVQNEVENDDADEDDLKVTEAKKMWWHAKLECGVVELYSKEALEWYRNTLNKMGNKFRAWSCQEKPNPRLKVWIKPVSGELAQW